MLSRFFVDRPIFATVLSVVIVIVGAVAAYQLPIAQYPEVVPPTIRITATYPGATANVVSDTVAAPIEQEVNGVENMLYMLSRSTNDGQLTLDVTFKVGTNIDMAQVLTQNRVSIATAKLPEEVRRQGVTTKKVSPAILLAVNMICPGGKYDQLFLSNYATTRVKDSLARLSGVGDVTFLGARDYSMRVWLDPDKLASRNMSAAEVVEALREQNVQVAAGRLGQSPAPKGLDFQYPLSTLGRLKEPEEFADVIIKTGSGGQVVRVKDVARTELGAKNYDVSSYLDGMPAITLAVFLLPGANALETSELVKAEMERLAKRFPAGVEYKIVYDTTIFIEESVHEVYKTLFEAFILVFIVVLVFLQDWRATLLPMIDVPVSLIGTFAVMAAMGFSLNNLSLFGLVLAIGIVVDDAIVVVENIERWMGKGLPVREATIRAMEEITGPVIAITLVLSSVFIPTAFIAGISGRFYQQFALTIASATIISAINALTMAPARAAQIFKSHDSEHGAAAHRDPLPNWGVGLILGGIFYWLFVPMVSSWFGLSATEHGEHASHAAGPAVWFVRAGVVLVGTAIGWPMGNLVNGLLRRFFVVFNAFFDRITGWYGAVVGRILRISVLVAALYVGFLVLTYFGFRAVPSGFIPDQDKGYLVVNLQLPDAASLERTEAVVAKVAEIARKTEGVAHTVAIPGYSILTGTNASNSGGMFVVLAPFEERRGRPEVSANAIARRLRQEYSRIEESMVLVFGAPAVDGLGSTGGFKMQVQDKGDAGSRVLQEAVESLIEKGNAQPGLVGLFSSFRASEPQLFIDIDRTKAKSQGLAMADVNDTLETYLGSAYVNDFTQFGRNWQVIVQADSKFRVTPDDISRLKLRSHDGESVPLGTLVTIREINGPSIVNRYNMFRSAEITGNPAAGTSSGQAITIMERLAGDTLPQSMDYEWTELTLQQILAGNTAPFVFALGTVFVFLVLSAQYENWSLPMAIILIVPLCLLPAITGIWMIGGDNNIFVQIGFVVLIGLAAKNAILVVEFAKERQGEGADRRTAVIDACRLRLRPILMTSFAFILGVVPLVVGTGAGAEMRQALGTAVFSGMLGVTAFGLLFTPVFYYLIQGWLERKPTSTNPPKGH